MFFFLVFKLVLRDKKLFIAGGDILLGFYIWGHMIFWGNRKESVVANRM